MLPAPKITNANIHPERFCASKMMRFLLCLLLIIFQLVGEAAPPRAEKTRLVPQAQQFGRWIDKTALLLLFLAVMGKKGPKKRGQGTAAVHSHNRVKVSVRESCNCAIFLLFSFGESEVLHVCIREIPPCWIIFKIPQLAMAWHRVIMCFANKIQFIVLNLILRVVSWCIFLS